MSKRKILIIDNERRMCHVLKVALETDGYEVALAFDGEEGIAKVRKGDYGVVITDLKMPNKDGLAVLSETRKVLPESEVIMMTAYASAQTAVEAMRNGAYDYLIKPFEIDELKLKVKQVFEKSRLATENLDLKKQLEDKFSIDNIIGQSEAMQKVYQMVRKVAPSDATVLIRGESGTGKELVARAIHMSSQRSEMPFVAVNCAALPETLLESELFGHDKGAFTGAEKQKPGRFELAAKGTIFLDEIGDISPATQVKLLRALQEKEMVRVGGQETLTIEARTIAATNRDLEEAMKNGAFRNDLYYRINVFPIFIPPLRERKDDIPDLILHFLTRNNAAADKINPAALKQLMKYNWHGNVRELENVVERSLILAGEEVVTPDYLPVHIRGEGVYDDSLAFEIPDEGLSIEEVEKNLIHKALHKAGGNKSKAAKLLGITRRRLYSMMERFEKK
ncbi:MAG: sigma-54 dependent transcriptional regulator [candidate division KSB1 bacterium]|jgi:two-component system NtrC family response regulator|nr:sigma-54 dependent transcriptional regulator [candidate division KSB1 bacterium]